MLLLDINVLVALAWPNHQFHAKAVRRMEASKEQWATCALTQLGFIRISANPALVTGARSAGDAVSVLKAMVADPYHKYLDFLPSPVREEIGSAFDRVLGSKQVIDAYLLALARKNDAVFLTFDTRLVALKGRDVKTEILGSNRSC